MTPRSQIRSTTLAALVVSILAPPASAIGAQQDSVVMRADSVTIRLVDVELPTAVQALSRFLDRPLAIGPLTNTGRVTLETPRPVPRSDVVRLLRGLLESQNIELVTDTIAGMYRLRMREPQRTPAAQGGSGPQGRAQGGQLPELFVIRLRHARATDVAATVNALYGRASALGEIGAPNPSATLARELQQNQAPPAAAPPPQAVVGASGRVASLSGEVTIVPDSRANSLLIRASRTDFDLIEAAVRELDVRPLQVLIEVLIAEVRKDRSFEFGVDAKLPRTHIQGTENTTIEGSTTGLGLGDFALKVMGVGGYDVEATLRAAASRGDATIVSRPILLAANNERAEINVGSQRPFVQVARVLPTDNTARDQVVQYKDVGTKLSVVPTISADGYVMLQVVQEINAATAEQQFNAPVISTRSVETRLLVNDGQTIVLGGLNDRQREKSQGGVPILSSIPILGGFFGRASRRSTETELFIFLTPRVIASDEDADSMTRPLRRRTEKIEHDD